MKRILAFFLLPAAALFATVTHSIAPQLDHYEQIDNLRRRNYAAGQWTEIETALARTGERLRMMTYNMLMDTHDRKLDACDRWPNRYARIVELIEHDRPDLICTQELQAHQIDELMELLGEDYLFFGRGELNGKRKGQHNGIIYAPARLELVEGQVLWMSDTPERVSTSPVDSRPRQVTVCHFRDRLTGAEFVAMSTHLRFNNPDSRAYSARFIGRLAEEQELPVIVGGDMNTFPNWPALAVLPFFDGPYIEKLFTEGKLRSSYAQAVAGHLGPISTFTTNPESTQAKSFQGTGRPGVILDHIYVSGDVTVLMHAVEPAQVDDHFPSDHLPVIADLVL